MIQDSAKKEITKSKKLIKKYTIIFDLDYDNAYSIPNPIEFSANERIGNLPEGYRAGYDFGGWFTEKDGNGKELINFFPVTDNMVAYAKWNKKNQQEFNAYGYSQNIRNLFNERGYISDYAYYPLELSALVVFSKDELHLLREKLEEDLKRGFGPGILSEDHLTNAYSHNINILALVEEYFPNENELNSKLNGLRCFAYRIPDQGYRWGDYLKLYKNGIFEYISRDFQATRYRNKIYGGSKFGLWTIDTEKNKNYEDNIEIIIIPEINENVENLYSYYNYKVDKTILIFNNIWMKVSEDYNVELDWGYKY
jgi:uncharacterized repeat protein (TIGR02543 family)